MIIEDYLGKSVCFVTCDMAHMSINVHRRVASRLLSQGIPLGPDQLFISATHSHSAGGNTLECEMFNKSVGPREGFDPVQEEFFVSGIAKAIEAAWARLEFSDVTAAWLSVRNATWNRSYEAYAMNDEVDIDPNIPPADPFGDSSVDREWFMLRAHRRSPSGTAYPIGAFSSFSIHPIGNPIFNDLLDPDLSGYSARALENHMAGLSEELETWIKSPAGDSTDGSIPYHLVASGTEGDVNPNMDGSLAKSDTYRDPINLEMSRRPGGPRTPHRPEEYVVDKDVQRVRRIRARLNLNTLGDQLGRVAVDVFADSARMTFGDSTRIAHAFETIDLSAVDGPFPLCNPPAEGLSTAAGGEGLVTPLDHWKMFGLIPLGIEEGGRAINYDSDDCQGAKRIILGSTIHKLVTHRRGSYPQYAQTMVVRIGNLWICGLPGELTTTVGRRIRKRVAGLVGGEIDSVRVIGLTNGYLGYVTTPEEYLRQNYEGGSTLYGPNESLVLEDSIRRLVVSILCDSPICETPPITLNHGPVHSYFPTPGHDVRGKRLRPLLLPVLRVASEPYDDHHTEVIVEWADLPPGVLAPADGRLIEIRGYEGAKPGPLIATDDSSDVEVRVVRWEKDSAVWRASWIVRKDLTGTFSLCVLPGKRPVHGLTVRFDLPNLKSATQLPIAGP